MYLNHVFSPKERIEQDPEIDTPKSRRRTLAGYSLMLLFLVLLGMLFRDATYGRIFIGVYGIVAIIAMIPSQQTYKMALISLASIPALSVVRGTTLSENFAQYAFLLFIIGVICTALEQYRTDQQMRRFARKGIKTFATPEDLK
jgi:cytochrome c biogenesis factor